MEEKVKYECEKCKKIYKNRQHLSRHKQSCQSSVVKVMNVMFVKIC